MRMSKRRFFVDVVGNTFMQMSINFWFMLSTQAIPTQLTAAIYQAAIGVVYVLSVLFLGEKLVWQKAVGVLIAVIGVCLSSLFPPLKMAAPSSSSASGGVPQEYDY